MPAAAVAPLAFGASDGFAQWGDAKAYPELVKYIEDKENNEQSRIEAVGMADELSRRLRSLADEYLIAVNKDRPEHLEAILSPSISPAE